jgi:hypothetical protein
MGLFGGKFVLIASAASVVLLGLFICDSSVPFSEFHEQAGDGRVLVISEVYGVGCPRG